MSTKGDRFKPLFTWRSAICESDLSPTTRHVALTLSLHMAERGDSAHPGAPLLARETGLSIRAVREHLALLERAGWLELVEKGGMKGARKRANEYRAAVPDPPLPITGAAESPVQQAAPTGERDDTDGCTTITPVHQEISTRSPEPPPSANGHRRNVLFDTLAEVWPSRTRAERKKIGMALAELDGADDITPEALCRRSLRLLQRAVDERWKQPTVLALAGHWSELAKPNDGPARAARPMCPEHGTDACSFQSGAGWVHAAGVT